MAETPAKSIPPKSYDRKRDPDKWLCTDHTASFEVPTLVRSPSNKREVLTSAAAAGGSILSTAVSSISCSAATAVRNHDCCCTFFSFYFIFKSIYTCAAVHRLDSLVVDARGVAHRGEFVDLVREPNNPYDRNAIRVDNLARQQVGWVSKERWGHRMYFNTYVHSYLAHVDSHGVTVKCRPRARRWFEGCALDMRRNIAIEILYIKRVTDLGHGERRGGEPSRPVLIWRGSTHRGSESDRTLRMTAKKADTQPAERP